MAFLSGLCCIGLLMLGIGYVFHIPFLQVLQHDARIAAAVMFMLIGYFHLAKPDKLTYMVEGMLPFPRLLVLGSGVLEILLGAGLLIPGMQQYAATGLIILLVMMFPANIRVAVKKLPAPGGLPASSWYTSSRLLFQPVYILWIWWAVHV
ncbi:MAG TPA: DoxX family membrane protein [Chitinophaga sp.]|uniref:DoxX family protein n=1 Tax=Chitinophaga sp. TaxID=1869181 RepID=UPI002BFDA40D|nr:DoxX family membrane protein [Chitinophaga sp.]HVI48599.1 DoxX family membrane protein [Chitinophaga sp.]